MSDRDRQKTNLLIEDSFSDSDVPDLNLEPPKSRKKKFKFARKLNGPRLPSVSFGYEEGGGGVGGGWRPPQCYSVSITFLLFSLVLGLSLLSWFTIQLHYQLFALQKTVTAQGTPPPEPSDTYAFDINALKDSIKELDSKMVTCCQKTNPSTSVEHSSSDEELQEVTAALSSVKSKIQDLENNIFGNISNIKDNVDTLQTRNTALISTTMNLTSLLEGQNKQLQKWSSCADKVCSGSSSVSNPNTSVQDVGSPAETGQTPDNDSNVQIPKSDSNVLEHPNTNQPASTLYVSPNDDKGSAKLQEAPQIDEDRAFSTAVLPITPTPLPKVRRRPGLAEPTTPPQRVIRTTRRGKP